MFRIWTCRGLAGEWLQYAKRVQRCLCGVGILSDPCPLPEYSPTIGSPQSCHAASQIATYNTVLITYTVLALAAMLCIDCPLRRPLPILPHCGSLHRPSLLLRPLQTTVKSAGEGKGGGSRPAATAGQPPVVRNLPVWQ